MLKVHQVRLLDAVKGAGLSPAVFKAEHETLPNGSSRFALSVPDSGLRFVAIAGPHTFQHFIYEYNTFSPARTLARSHEFVNLDNIVDKFKLWLGKDVMPYLAERDTPEPWATIPEPDFTGIALADPEDTSQFSTSEQESILEGLARFRSLVAAEYELNAEQLGQLDRRIAYLSQAVRRLDRFDWKGVALSSIVTIATALALDTNQGRHLAELFKQAFTEISWLLR